MFDIYEDEGIEEIFQGFWVDIVCPNGVWDLEQVKKELADYCHLLREVPKVYVEVTKGRISKPHTYAFEVINVFEDQFHDAKWCPNLEGESWDNEYGDDEGNDNDEDL